jgi:hypothetical protein
MHAAVECQVFSILEFSNVARLALVNLRTIPYFAFSNARTAQAVAASLQGLLFLSIDVGEPVAVPLPVLPEPRESALRRRIGAGYSVLFHCHKGKPGGIGGATGAPESKITGSNEAIPGYHRIYRISNPTFCLG